MNFINRRRVTCSRKCCLEGKCPPIIYFKTVNGVTYSGNGVIKGSELTGKMQYAQKINTAAAAPLHWKRILVTNNLNIFGSIAGAPAGSRGPPKNVF
jgi:hypothetical protein